MLRYFDKVNLHLEDVIKEKTKELRDINNDLNSKIKQEIEISRKKDLVIYQQAKLASLGEMLNNIAHQWRQPLNELGINVQNLKFKYKKGLINKEFIDNFVSRNKDTIMFMSKTIDDFRSFFKTDKVKKDFSILKAIHFCINMQLATLKNKNIKINIDDKDFTCNGLEGEFKQVVLNIINNAKDAFETSNTKDRKLDILISDKRITFTDNAGGIPQKIISRIFEPYFTTKAQGNGTGIGLYMSKTMIENNGGLLSVYNVNDGACFVIDFSKKEYNETTA